jgi:myo-inositol-1(or 4)-monophosphatase
VPARSDVVDLLEAAAGAAGRALSGLEDWGPAGTRAGQYRSDLVADEAVCAVLEAAGVAVLSEESGAHGSGDLLVVVDPVDGSTNAARGLPWFATSLCALDAHGPLAALVVNQATGATYRAFRGEGAWRDGRPLRPSGCTRAREAILGLSGYPARYLGWRQYRALGAVALDLCAVAEGALDGYLDCSRSAHGPWDYLGGLLVCREAGAPVADRLGRELVVRESAERRTPVAAATPELLAELLERVADAG